MPEGRTRVEPDFQNVGALGVERRFFGTQNVFSADAAPGLDTAFGHHVSGLVDDLHGARVQCARVHVQEERDRHAPAALARDAPVGPASDHVAQASLAVFRVEVGVVDGFQSDLAQCLFWLLRGISEHAFAFIHADEPLGRCTVDHRRLVAPAMWVAVGDGLGINQTIGHFECVQNDGHSLPDVLAAEHAKIRRIHAVALHRVQDLFVLHAVGHA